MHPCIKTHATLFNTSNHYNTKINQKAIERMQGPGGFLWRVDAQGTEGLGGIGGQGKEEI